VSTLFVLLAPTSDMLPAKVSQLTNGGLRVEYVSSFVGLYAISAKFVLEVPKWTGNLTGK